MSRRKSVDPQALADAIATLREVIRQYPNTMLALASKAAIELREPGPIREAAKVLGRRLVTAPKRPADLID